MIGYFYIVQSGVKDTENVLEVTEKFEDKSLMEAIMHPDVSKLSHRYSPFSNELKVTKWKPEKTQQLWRWTNDGLLENKHSKLIINVENGKLDEGTKVIVWPITGKARQKFHIVNGTIKNIQSNNLIIGIRRDGSLELSNSKKCDQKWLLVPEAMFDYYCEYLQNMNPLTKAVFLKSNLMHIECVLGCTVDEYKNIAQRCVEVTSTCAEKLEKVTKDVGIAKTTGGAVSIIAGGASIIGLALVPFTAGASLALTVGGATFAVAGGMTSTLATITAFGFTKSEAKKIKHLVEKGIRVTYLLHSMLVGVVDNMEKANTFSKTNKGKRFIEFLKVSQMTLSLASNAIPIYSTGIKVHVAATAVKQIRAVTSLGQVDGILKGAAEVAAADGFKVSGRVLIPAGSTAARAYSGSFAALGIIFGIIDIVDGAIKINSGSPLAKDWKKTAKEISELSNQLISSYDELIRA